jgi:methionyl-tRNA formyltransferase
MRVIAVGTPAFALPTFDALHQAPDVEIAQVITKAERPGGRGLKPIYPPVYEWARDKGLHWRSSRAPTTPARAK